MVRQVGIHCMVSGAAAAIAKLRRFGRALGTLDRRVGHHSGSIGGSFSRLSNMMMRSPLMTGAAIAGLSAVAAGMAALPAKLAMSRTELSKHQGALRRLGMTDEEINNLEESMRKFTNRYGAFTQEGLNKAFYQIQSTMGHLNAATKTELMKITALGGWSVEMGTKAAADYFGAMWGSLKEQYKDMGPQAFAQMIWAQTQEAVKLMRTTGPELQSAMKYAVPALGGGWGWKLSNILGAAAVMRTAGLEPEQAGTSLRNMGMKMREGVALIMAMGEAIRKGGADAWDKMKPKAQGALKAQAEKVLDTTKLLETGLIPVLKEMQKHLDIMSKGQRVKALKKAFETEGAGGVNILLQHLEQANELIKKMESARFENIRQMADAFMNRGIAQALDLIRNRWENLRKLAGKIFEMPFGGILERIGEQFKAGQEWIKEHQGNLKAGADAFAESFGASFSSALAQSAPELAGQVERLKSAFSGPDTAAWKSLADSLGKIAGITLGAIIGEIEGFKKLIKDVTTMYEQFSAIAPAAKEQALATLGLTQKTERREALAKAYEKAPWVPKEFDETMGKVFGSLIGPSALGFAAAGGRWLGEQFLAPSVAAAPALAAPAPTGAEAAYSRDFGGIADAISAAISGQPITVHVDTTVRVDQDGVGHSTSTATTTRGADGDGYGQGVQR